MMVPRGDHLMVLSKTLKTYEQIYARVHAHAYPHTHAHTHAHTHWQLVKADRAWEGWCPAVCVPMTWRNVFRCTPFLANLSTGDTEIMYYVVNRPFW
jgi:hypothetical protein